jgi:hypothetical protein
LSSRLCASGICSWISVKIFIWQSWDLCDVLRRKQPEICTARRWHLHHDNVPAHTVLSIGQSWQNIQFLPFHNLFTWPLLYWLFLFPELIITPQAKKFQTVEVITIALNILRRLYHKYPSNIASKSGKDSGRSGLLCMETILKGLICSKLWREKDIYSHIFHEFLENLIP